MLQAVSTELLGGGGADGAGLPPPGSVGPGSLIRVPSSAQRRMEQCLGLARDLLAAQSRADSMDALAQSRQAEVDKLREELAEAQRLLRRSNQPQVYLAEQVQKAEATQRAAERQLASLAQQKGEHADALAAAQQENAMLRADLERVISQRGALEALRSTLTRLVV